MHAHDTHSRNPIIGKSFLNPHVHILNYSTYSFLFDDRTLASPQIVILLVGNKRDLEEEREVTFLEASRFAQENGLMFLETSAKTGQCVEESFLKCSKNILAKIETGELDPERIGSGKHRIGYLFMSRSPIGFASTTIKNWFLPSKNHNCIRIKEGSKKKFFLGGGILSHSRP